MKDKKSVPGEGLRTHDEDGVVLVVIIEYGLLVRSGCFSERRHIQRRILDKLSERILMVGDKFAGLVME